MPYTALEPIHSELTKSLKYSRHLSAVAHRWTDPAAGPKTPKFSPAHRHALIEVAFLRSCLAWESFLEESFVLYILGKKPRLRKLPRKRYILPPNRDHAFKMLLPEQGSRTFVEWDKPDTVLTRAKRLLRGGEPFESAMAPHLNALHEIRTIRNAIAHRSSTSQEKFEAHVRNRLGALPPDHSVGAYLDTLSPGSTPPITEFDRYVQVIEAAAAVIAR